MKENISEYIQKVIKKTVENYEAVLKQYFPSFEKRFIEHNLTFFFAHNYLNFSVNSVIWQELPIKFEGKPMGLLYGISGFVFDFVKLLNYFEISCILFVSCSYYDFLVTFGETKALSVPSLI